MADTDGTAPAESAPAESDAPATANGSEQPADGNIVMDIDSDLEDMGMKVQFDIGDELDDEGADDGAGDSERLPRETQAFPALHALEETEPEGRKAKVFQKFQQEAAEALKAANLSQAIEKYTEAMRIGGATPQLLAHRAALLLKQKRPCAAVRDCTAAIKINPHVLQAYRLRGIAHRKLGHWKKSHRDLSEAQNINWDKGTAEVHKFVQDKLGINKGNAVREARKERAKEKEREMEREREKEKEREKQNQNQRSAPPQSWTGPSTYRPPSPYDNPVPPPKELDVNQAVFVCGLQKAPQLNGKRGVVQRPDPRPEGRGRWEIEVRLDAGRVEIKSLKGENIMTLNKADKVACRTWMREEKKHLEEIKNQEKLEQKEWAKKRFEGKMLKITMQESTRALLRQLPIETALELLDKAEDKDVRNANSFLANQARMKLGHIDSSSDEEGGGRAPEEHDPERLAEDKGPYPVIPYNPDTEISDEQMAATNRAKKQAMNALERNDLPAALHWYTEAVNAGGAAGLMLARRGEVLLKMKRPNAAIHDCTAAIEINPDCGKAYHVRGIAHRKLGHWEESNDDFSQGQNLDFDDAIVPVHNFVSLKVNAMQERGVKRRKTGAA